MDFTGSDARARVPEHPGALVFMLIPAAVVVVLLFGGGLFLGLLQSLGRFPGTGSFGLGHFKTVLTDPDFMKSLGLTFYISGVSTLAAMILSVGAALLLTSYSRFSRVLHFLFQIPLVAPHIVVAASFMLLFAPTGLLSRAAAQIGLVEDGSHFPLLINDSWGIGIMAAYVFKEIPFITLMVVSVLHNTGRDLIDAAKTLRAGPARRFFHVVLPTIFPSLSAAGLIVFAYTFGAFEVPWLLGRTWPVTLPVWAYKNYSDVDLMARPEGIAAGMIIAAVVAGFVLFAGLMLKLARKRGLII